MSLYDQMRLGALPPLGLPELQGGVMQPMGLPPLPSLMSLQGAPVATQPEMGSSVPEDSFSRARRIIRETMASAPQEIDPDIAALLQRREERLAQQEAQAEERARPNAWRELVRIGTAMMGTRSPQFGQGLAQGLMATVEEQQKRRDELERQRAAIEQAREGIELKRIEQRGAGRKRAMEELKTTMSLAKDIGGIEGDELKNQAARINNEFAPAEARAKLAKLNEETINLGVDRALDNARIATERAQQAKYYADAQAARQGGGGASTPTTQFERRAAEILRTLGPEAYNEFIATGKVTAAAGSASPQETLQLIGQAKSLLPKATSGGLQRLGATAREFVGLSSERSESDAALNVVAARLAATVPRFEGPQSDKDVAAYNRAVGDVGNRDLPAATRMAALREVEAIVRRNADRRRPEGQSAGGAGGGNTVTVNGKTYTFPSAQAAAEFRRRAGIR